MNRLGSLLNLILNLGLCVASNKTGYWKVNSQQYFFELKYNISVSSSSAKRDTFFLSD